MGTHLHRACFRYIERFSAEMRSPGHHALASSDCRRRKYMSAKKKGGRGHRGILEDVCQWKRAGCSEEEIRGNLKRKGYRLARISQLMSANRSPEMSVPELEEPPIARSAEHANEDPRGGASNHQSIKRKTDVTNDEIEESDSEVNEETVYAKWSLDGAKFVQREVAAFLNNSADAECTLPRLRIMFNSIPPQILELTQLDGVPTKLANVQRLPDQSQVTFILQKLNGVTAKVAEFFERQCPVGAPTSADSWTAHEKIK